MKKTKKQLELELELLKSGMKYYDEKIKMVEAFELEKEITQKKFSEISDYIDKLNLEEEQVNKIISFYDQITKDYIDGIISIDVINVLIKIL